MEPIYGGVKRKLLNLSGLIHVGNNSKVVGPIYCTGQLTVGKNVWVGRNLRIEGNGKVKIGDNCDLAPNITFYTGSHQIGNADRRAGKGYNGNVTIGAGCWLCGSSVYLPDVSVGDSSVVAAGALVNKNIEQNVLAAGVPIRTIRSLD